MRISVLLLNLNLLLLLVLDTDEIEQVGNKISFNFEIKLSVRVQARTQIDFKQPGLKIFIYQYVETEQLEAIIVFLVRVDLR